MIYHIKATSKPFDNVDDCKYATIRTYEPHHFSTILYLCSWCLLFTLRVLYVCICVFVCIFSCLLEHISLLFSVFWVTPKSIYVVSRISSGDSMVKRREKNTHTEKEKKKKWMWIWNYVPTQSCFTNFIKMYEFIMINKCTRTIVSQKLHFVQRRETNTTKSALWREKKAATCVPTLRAYCSAILCRLAWAFSHRISFFLLFFLVFSLSLSLQFVSFQFVFVTYNSIELF